MARSVRKTPIVGNCCGEDAPARRKGNKAQRRAVHVALVTGAANIPDIRNIRGGDPWDWPQDGRRFRHDPEPAWLRK